MRSFNKFVVALLATGVLAAIPSASFGFPGQPGRPGRPGQSGPNSALAAGRQQVKDAQADVSEAQKDLTRIRNRVKASFDGSKEYAKAQAAVRKAKAAYDAAVRKAKADLLKEEGYAATVAKRDEAKTRLDELNFSGGADADINTAAQQVTELGLEIKKLELEAIDGNDEISAAKDKLEEARKTLEALDDELTEALESDEDYIEAEQALELAKDQLETARLALADKVRAEAQSRAQQRQSTRPQKTQRSRKSR